MSQAGSLSGGGSSGSITITGNTGGAQTGTSFTFTGGTTGLSFDGAANVFTTTFAGITANGGTVSLATDATASTVNIGSGAGAKTVQLGSTNTTSSLALRYGTSDFTLASATGTVMSALDTGEITYPLQPAFLALLPTIDTNATGNGAVYTLGGGTLLQEIFDQGNDFNINGTFQAPVTGKYYIAAAALVIGCTIATTFNLRFVSSNNTFLFQTQRDPSSANLGYNGSTLLDMDAGDTLTVTIQVAGEAADTCSIFGDASPICFISGNLVC